MKIVSPLISSLRYLLSSAEREAYRTGIPTYIDKELRIVNGFDKLVESRPNPEQWLHFNELVTHSEKKEELISTYTSLVQSEPTSDEWKLFEDLLSVYEFRIWDINPLIKSSASVFKLKPNTDQLVFLDDMTKSYLENNTKVEHFLSGFARLLKSNPNTEQFNLFKDKAYAEIKKNKRIGVLTYLTADIIPLNPTKEKLNLVFNIYDYYRQKKWISNVERFNGLRKALPRLIKAELNVEQLKIYEDLLDNHKQFNDDLCEATLNYLDLVKDLSPIKWNVFKIVLNYYKKNDFFFSDALSSFHRFKDVEVLDKCWSPLIKLLNKRIDAKLLVDDVLDAFIDISDEKDSEKLKFYIEKLNRCSEKNLPLDDLIPVIKANPSEDEWNIFETVIESNVDQQYLDSIVRSFYDSILAKPTHEQWSVYKNLLEKSKNSIELESITNGFYELVVNKAPKLLFDAYEINCTSPGAANCLASLAKNKENISNAMLKTYLNSIKKNPIIDDSLKLLKEITVHSAITAMVRSDLPETRKIQGEIISETIKNDHVPFSLRDPSGLVNLKAKIMSDETLNVYARAYDIYHGFSAFTVETKRPPEKEPALLPRFGSEVAKRVKYINAKDVTMFPGRGFLISFIQPEKVFTPDTNIKKGEDPYHKYKAAWNWLSDEFNDLQSTHFIFTRGMIVITCASKKKEEKYSLKDIDDKQIHYSYVILNDHFHNNNLHSAFLVPTKLLDEKLKGTMKEGVKVKGAVIEYKDYRGPSLEHKDVNEIGLTIENLIKEAKQIPANILNIGWGSNVGGGLCNAYPPNSKPYHEWEWYLNETEDAYGHVHKSHMLTGYKEHMTPELEKGFIPLREAHDKIYALTNSYQNLLDLFRISLSYWHKKEPLRMLEEAYKYHKGYKEGLIKKEDCPILVSANTLDWWNKPNSLFALDTSDMILSIEDKKIPFDSEGIGIIEENLWNKLIMPLVENTDGMIKDFRFYNRKDLGIS